MTDNEIKIYLECFISEFDERISTDKIMIVNKEGMINLLKIMVNSLASINRQQAEIERLRYNLEAVLNERADHSEAIKEFAERLNDKTFKINYCGSAYNVIDIDDIDNLVKEMMGEKMKYRKKPVVIEAIQFTQNNFSEIKEFINNLAHSFGIENSTDMIATCIIPTLEGDHIATEGDYIIKGVKGEFYPCKPDIFEMTYEMVGDTE